MSIGEAEDYRYYWKEEWRTNPPMWVGEEHPLIFHIIIVYSK